MTVVAKKNKSLPNVNMGQLAIIAESERVGTVLGSCVGLVLYHPRKKIGAMAHIVLPNSKGDSSQPAKYADTAIPHLIQLLEQQGANPSGLVALITGGASMFGTNAPMQIGSTNVDTVRQALSSRSIRVRAEHVGGKKGRRITFDSHTGFLTVEIVGCDPVVI